MRTNHEAHEQSLASNPAQIQKQREYGSELTSHDDQKGPLGAAADAVDHHQDRSDLDNQGHREPRSGEFLGVPGGKPEKKNERRIGAEPQHETIQGGVDSL